MKKFVSKPNKCEGCPIEKYQPVRAKVANKCVSAYWKVTSKLDDLGRTICVLELKRKI